MATYYISVDIDNENVIYALDATTNISVTSTGELSRHRLEDGNMASDNYRSEPNTISISGVISDVFVGNNISQADRKTTKEYIEGLKKVKDSATPFTVHYASDLTPVYPCFFSKFSFSQGRENGFYGVSSTGQHINSYQISADIVQTRIGQAATFTVGKASEFVDPTQNRTSASASTKGVSDEYNELIREGTREAVLGDRAQDEALSGNI